MPVQALAGGGQLRQPDGRCRPGGMRRVGHDLALAPAANPKAATHLLNPTHDDHLRGRTLTMTATQSACIGDAIGHGGEGLRSGRLSTIRADQGEAGHLVAPPA